MSAPTDLVRLVALRAEEVRAVGAARLGRLAGAAARARGGALAQQLHVAQVERHVVQRQGGGAALVEPRRLLTAPARDGARLVLVLLVLPLHAALAEGVQTAQQARPLVALPAGQRRRVPSRQLRHTYTAHITTHAMQNAQCTQCDKKL